MTTPNAAPHDSDTCSIDLCPDCPESCEAEAEYDDSAFGYTPGEDRSPAETRILENEAFLPDHEVQALLAKARAGRHYA